MSSPSNGGAPKNWANTTLSSFAASLGAGLAAFAAQVAVFYLLRNVLPRIYRPRTYLVPESERIKEPPRGWFKWITPVFATPNSEFIHKCGLDAYFFLRYLRLLLKIFIPVALLVLPILLPLNAVHGAGVNAALHTNHTGLDTLAWGNITPAETHKYWAHLVLAVFTITYVCFASYGELGSYIRLRQAYLTSPQHRLRASATTVLVTGIPNKWLTYEALSGLFDVFPGGIRNIWINRNFQTLSDKVDLRNGLAKKLESAEANLIQTAKKKQLERAQKEAKKQKKSKNKGESLDGSGSVDKTEENRISHIRGGISAGNPHQMQSLRDFMEQRSPNPADGEASPLAKRFESRAIRGVSDAAGAGLGLVTGAFNKFGKKNPPVGDNSGMAETSGSFENKESISNVPQSYDGAGSVTSTAEKHELSAKDGEPNIDDLDAVTRTNWRPWKKNHVRRPSPRPHTKDERDSPFRRDDQAEDIVDDPVRRNSESASSRHSVEYPKAFDEKFADATGDEGAEWKRYLKSGDRPTTRLPLFGQTWLPYMPSWTFIGKKVDTIYYCRKELARLNAEIETDQKNPEKYPLMSSAFIQFNNQVAAHMACQSLSHHFPLEMAPRLIEVSPDDVIWDNMSIRWWERYIRTSAMFIIIVAMSILWAIPVAFTGSLSRLSNLADKKGFHWINSIPRSALSLLEGIISPALMQLLFIIVPPIMELLANQSGVYTRTASQLRVQNSYFFFLFVQLFLIVTIGASVVNIIAEVSANVGDIPNILASNLPDAATYFFNYMTLQGLSTSAGALLQIVSLLFWFLLGPLLDSTPRQKWHRQINLSTITWGKFFPVYTNLAVIGLVYCIIAPLILIFNIGIFGLFWFVYRYNTLYVNKFKIDTGGLLFPRAINQLFTGLYTMELCLIGLFFLIRDEHGNVSCKAQGIIMVVVALLTALYQWQLNSVFYPLLKYLPITLEDEAVLRDEDFAKAHAEHQLLLQAHPDEHDTHASETNSLNNPGLERPEKDNGANLSNVSTAKTSSDDKSEDIEMTKLDQKYPERSSSKAVNDGTKLNRLLSTRKKIPAVPQPKPFLNQPGGGLAVNLDPETQQLSVGDSKNPQEKYLFQGVSDVIEDLTVDERDELVNRAFQHRALRARRPVIWIPRDDLGVSDDEVKRTSKLTDYIWISNEGAGLDEKCRCVYAGNPPDFSEIDLIRL